MSLRLSGNVVVAILLLIYIYIYQSNVNWFADGISMFCLHHIRFEHFMQKVTSTIVISINNLYCPWTFWWNAVRHCASHQVRFPHCTRNMVHAFTTVRSKKFAFVYFVQQWRRHLKQFANPFLLFVLMFTLWQCCTSNLIN